MSMNDHGPMSAEQKAAIEKHLPEAREIFLRVYGPSGDLNTITNNKAGAWECLWQAICKVEPLLPYTVFLESTTTEAATAWVLSKAKQFNPPDLMLRGAQGNNERLFQLSLANAQLCQTRAAYFHSLVQSGASAKNYENVSKVGGESLTADELIKRDLDAASRHIELAQRHLDFASRLPTDPT